MSSRRRRGLERARWYLSLIGAACLAAGQGGLRAEPGDAAKSSAPAAESAAPAVEIATEEGLTFGRGGDSELQLDLARPAQGTGPFPGLVYIHGGGWYAGNRSMYRAEIAEAAQRGYVAVTVSYRLTDVTDGKAKNPFPAQVEDVKCAVRWLRANAAKYHVDAHRIGAKGASAGGHLSLMLGTTEAAKEFEGNGGQPDVSSAVQAVVNFYGPTDLPRLHETGQKVPEILENFLGGPPAARADAYRAASPIVHLSKSSAPTLTLHGADDPIVPVEQAIRLDARAREVGAPHTLTVLDGEKHGFSKEVKKKARAASFEFFDKHLKR
jgi:acetyl esterase/lipase